MTIEVVTKLELVTCADCSMAFGVPQHFEKDRRRDHQGFYCPKGHNNYFPGKSDIERAQAEAKKAKAEAKRDREDGALAWSRFNEERADHVSTQASLRTTKGHVTRMRKRIAAGTCPWCEQQFPDLEAHVGEEHPDQEELKPAAADS